MPNRINVTLCNMSLGVYSWVTVSNYGELTQARKDENSDSKMGNEESGNGSLGHGESPPPQSTLIRPEILLLRLQEIGRRSSYML